MVMIRLQDLEYIQMFIHLFPILCNSSCQGILLISDSAGSMDWPGINCSLKPHRRGSRTRGRSMSCSFSVVLVDLSNSFPDGNAERKATIAIEVS